MVPIRSVEALIYQGFCQDSWDGMNLQRMNLLFGLICFSVGLSLTAPVVAADPSPSASGLWGSWQRVYDQCGQWIPSDSSELLARSREYVPLREVYLALFDGFYLADIRKSRACSMADLKTHSTPDCREGLNEGVFEVHFELNLLMLRASDLRGFPWAWGGIIDFYIFELIDDEILILRSFNVGCSDQPWSIYFLPSVSS